jgi:hypothetical protein
MAVPAAALHAPRRRGKVGLWLPFFGLLAALHAVGWPYYVADAATRVRHPLHPWLKPSGYVGQAAGLLTFALFAFMWLYPLRKRVRWLARFGTMAGWLEVHIVAGLVLPFVGAVHAAWRFQGVIGVGYAALLTVCLSGVVGRYLYTRIPRSHAGIELDLDQIRAQQRALVLDIASATGLPAQEIERGLAEMQPAPAASSVRGGIAATFAGLVAGDLRRWTAGARLRRRWRSVGAGPRGRSALRRAVRLARREIALTQRARMLEATRRVFRFWHVAHRPFALTAFVAVTIHVVVVVVLGVTWLG